MDVPTNDKIEMCERNIKWCEESKLVFLSQRLKSRMAYLLYCVFICIHSLPQNKQYRQSLNLCNYLIRELAKIDDKSLTMEVHVIEARVYKDLNDITKAKVPSPSIFHPGLLDGLQNGRDFHLCGRTHTSGDRPPLRRDLRFISSP